MKLPRLYTRDLLWLVVVALLLLIVCAQWMNLRSDPATVYAEAHNKGFKLGWRQRGIYLGLPKDQWDVMPPIKTNSSFYP